MIKSGIGFCMNSCSLSSAEMTLYFSEKTDFNDDYFFANLLLYRKRIYISTNDLSIENRNKNKTDTVIITLMNFYELS